MKNGRCLMKCQAIILKFKAGRYNYMRKRITITLEVDTDDKTMITDDFIKNDLEQEINCASNSYDIISIETKELT